MDIAQLLMQQLAGGGLSQISEQIGANKSTTQSALSAAVPLLVSALARNASEPAGAKSLHTALANDHDGSVLDDLSGFLGDPAAANGAGILGHVLGNQQPAVANTLAKSTGLDAGQVGQLLQIAAPLVMGVLGKQQQTQKLNPQGLSNYLGSEQKKAEKSNPDIMGTLNKILDADQDGSGLDEVAGMLGRLLGG